MDRERAAVVFYITARKESYDLEIPLDITANELVTALNTAYQLDIDLSDMKNCYLKSESPIALLRGNRKLAEYGLRNGSVIYFTE